MKLEKCVTFTNTKFKYGQKCTAVLKIDPKQPPFWAGRC